MTYSSSLANKSKSLILDTSVLINLHASTHGESILEAIPNPLIVPAQVFSELEHETSKANGEHRFMSQLLADRVVHVAELDDKEWELFEKIVSGSNSLGDGEAAAIAIASNRNYIPVIDDQRGRAQAISLSPDSKPAWSLDLFFHPSTKTALDEQDHVAALYRALRYGRMRVSTDHCDQVVDAIGIHCALECTSLPGYKRRKSGWQKDLEDGRE